MGRVRGIHRLEGAKGVCKTAEGFLYLHLHGRGMEVSGGRLRVSPLRGGEV
jgi:hypothetical protein